MKLQTNTPIDKLLDGGLEYDTITNIYGPPGSGKTNIALAALLNCVKNKKVIYMDTEGSFSFERFKQLGGTEKDLKNIIFLDVHSWDEQHKEMQNLENIIKKSDIGLIVIDSLVALYRLELDNENFQKINKQLATQYSILSRITRKFKIPILVTNQVYSLKDEKIEMISRAIAKYWSKTLIELKKLDKENQRIALLRKHRSLPEGKKVEFEITENGLKMIGKFSTIF
ncbi:MAG: DNA repair and recombination protein RadB [Candidatus Aenigmatarchaeota archaeon]